MVTFPEAGYTPTNLKFLLAQSGLTREDAASLLQVSLRAVHRWCTSIDAHQHRDMPYSTWVRLLAEIERAQAQWEDAEIPEDAEPSLEAELPQDIYP